VQTKPSAMHFLNFEGSQRVRLQEEATSSVRSANIRAAESQRQPEEDQEEVGDHANSISHEEERELMKGVEDIDVAVADKDGGLLPVYGSDGVQ
jgi:hypothetical protein